MPADGRREAKRGHSTFLENQIAALFPPPSLSIIFRLEIRPPTVLNFRPCKVQKSPSPKSPSAACLLLSPTTAKTYLAGRLPSFTCQESKLENAQFVDQHPAQPVTANQWRSMFPIRHTPIDPTAAKIANASRERAVHATPPQHTVRLYAHNGFLNSFLRSDFCHATAT